MTENKTEYQIRRTATHFIVLSGVVPELFTQEGGNFLTHDEAEEFVDALELSWLGYGD